MEPITLTATVAMVSALASAGAALMSRIKSKRERSSNISIKMDGYRIQLSPAEQAELEKALYHIKGVTPVETSERVAAPGA